MRIFILLVLIFSTAQAGVDVAPRSFMNNCLRGYKQSLRYMRADSVDPLAPQDANAIQLCQTLYNNDTEYKHFPWVMESISFLKVPKNDIKLAEFSSAEGNCELGSYFAQKMYRANLSIHDTVKFAKKRMSQAIDYLDHLIHPFQNEADLLKAIEELSLKFTQERERIGDYLKDPRLVSAYTAFYLTTNLPKWEGVMNWMPAGWRDLIKKCDLVDLGAGPGTFSLAYKSWGGEGDVYQVEISDLMREQAAKLWPLKAQGSKLYQGPRWNWNSEKPKLLLFGHSANEMGVEKAIEYIETINPEHILFIEPGTKDFFPKMLEIRRYLLQKNFHLLFPCPDKLECPLKGTDDWCHQYLKVTHDMEIERLSQLAKKDRRMLPLTVQAFSRSFQVHEAPLRVVRVLPETKFSFEWEVCEGKEVASYQVMKRGMNKKEQKEISLTLAGAAVEVELEKVLPEAKRVRLIKINH